MVGCMLVVCRNMPKTTGSIQKLVGHINSSVKERHRSYDEHHHHHHHCVWDHLSLWISWHLPRRLGSYFILKATEKDKTIDQALLKGIVHPKCTFCHVFQWSVEHKYILKNIGKPKSFGYHWLPFRSTQNGSKWETRLGYQSKYQNKKMNTSLKLHEGK